MHPWHDVDLGAQAPEIVPAIIETPKGSKTKYELDQETGLIQMDRMLSSALRYPANYGFFPRTYCSDQNPLDVLILGLEPLVPLSILRVKPIGLMKMIDQGKSDDKIIAVQSTDPEYSSYESIEDLPMYKILALKRFFKSYQAMETKMVIVQDFLGRHDALQVIRDSISLYQQKKEELLLK